MSLAEHLSELRRRVVVSALAIVVGAIVVFTFYNQVLHVLSGPYRQVCNVPKYSCVTKDGAFILTDPLAPFGTRIRISGWGGVVLALPVVLWQIWQFVVPALHKNERRYAIPFVLSSVVLFFFGASIAYLTLEKALEFLIAWAGPNFSVAFTPDKYVRLVTLMMLAFGGGFLFPVLQVFLTLIGVLKTKQLLHWWRHAIVVICGVAAVITPSGDPISLFALAIPMWVFYFAAIGVGHLLTRKRVADATD